MTEGRPAWQQVVAPQETERADGADDPAELPPLHVIPDDRVDDARERADWFRRLPEHVKDELRDQWRHDEGTGDRQRARRHRNMKAYALETAGAYLLLCLASTFLGGRLDFTLVLFAVVSGAATGAACAILKPGAPGHTALFTVGFAATLVFGGLLAGATTSPGTFLQGAFLSIFVVCMGVALGLSHRLQRFDGSE